MGARSFRFLMRIGRGRLYVRGFGAWREEEKRMLTVEIVDILVGVGRDDGFWCLSGHGEVEISRNLVLFISGIATPDRMLKR